MGIQHSNIVADSIGHKQPIARFVHGHARRFLTHRPGCNHGLCSRVDHREGIVPGVRYIEPVAGRRERKPARHAAHGNRLDEREARRIQDTKFIALLAEHIEARAIRRKQDLQRGGKVLRGARIRLRGSMNSPAGPRGHREKHQGHASYSRTCPNLNAPAHVDFSMPFNPVTADERKKT